MARKTTVARMQETREAERHIKALVRNQVHFVSGTISPAKGNVETVNPESIEHALQHYATRGYNKVCVQVKDMGSRANVYLYPKLEDCFIVTRKGYKLRDVKDLDADQIERGVQALDIEEIVKPIWEQHMQGTGDRLMILDAELMPWNALADELIEREYAVITDSISREIEALETLGFTAALHGTTKPNAQTAKYINNVQCLASRESDSNALKHQIGLFVDKECEPYLKPFNILKIIDAVGDVDVCIDEFGENYERVGTEEMFVFDPNDGVTDELYAFLDKVAERELEGVMVKPYVYEPSLRAAPMLKVRNKEYLRITYGYNYDNDDNIVKLIKSKDIAGKVRESIRQHQLGTEMLSIPTSGYLKSNDRYVHLCTEMVKSIRRCDNELDPRL